MSGAFGLWSMFLPGAVFVMLVFLSTNLLWHSMRFSYKLLYKNQNQGPIELTAMDGSRRKLTSVVVSCPPCFEISVLIYGLMDEALADGLVARFLPNLAVVKAGTSTTTLSRTVFRRGYVVESRSPKHTIAAGVISRCWRVCVYLAGVLSQVLRQHDIPPSDQGFHGTGRGSDGYGPRG